MHCVCSSLSKPILSLAVRGTACSGGQQQARRDHQAQDGEQGAGGGYGAVAPRVGGAAGAPLRAGPSVRLVIARIGPIAIGSASRPISGSMLPPPATRAIGRTTK